MINIAIVEDDLLAADNIRKYLEQYSGVSGESFDVSHFETCSSVLYEYKAKYDIIFLDIELPNGNGMELAEKIRKLDTNVTLIFVTNMAQYAIKGYAVNALDFMVKPINYYSFSTMLARALKMCKRNRQVTWTINTTDGIVRIDLRNIMYVEVSDHRLIYHTDDGLFEEWGKISELENKLSDKGFYRGNNCYLINLGRVVGLVDMEVKLPSTTLQLSRSRKKPFAKAFVEFSSGSSN